MAAGRTNIQRKRHKLVDVHEPHGEVLPDGVWQHGVNVICRHHDNRLDLHAWTTLRQYVQHSVGAARC